MKAAQNAADEPPDEDDAPPQEGRPLSIGFTDLRGEDQAQLLLMSHKVRYRLHSGSDSLLVSQRVTATSRSTVAEEQGRKDGNVVKNRIRVRRSFRHLRVIIKQLNV